MPDTWNSLEQQVWKKLQEVTDPEITSVSLLEMGMVESIHVAGRNAIIRLIPTYVGCPALHMMKEDVIAVVSELDGIDRVEVQFVKSPIWTSDRITDEGREKLKKSGISTPQAEFKQEGIWEAECPYCGSPKTVMNNVFGPTSCRSIFYCNQCKNPFEAIKPV
ncbi:phenylacetate-CoA oxygenase subunit PaaJ [Paenibacillus sp. MZ04-78.2]|uniref:1,2-phenylacetyl-CoA epoxidase subunit PaaD n=1 Tax=Paenibacillus sp. MZ04-78.2 TaxID=2962034 RepID=UPI0020B6891D|nr:1,2-phenylacetyl-CoA epoxidase subunit PaaD [Paenibacillus sp. MZ04-78.2]MCP3772770.1 phenylacetate-CoA oxygenase subunit PaaJ [Paenibacillus sp. MZ04-78.2]